MGQLRKIRETKGKNNQHEQAGTTINYKGDVTHQQSCAAASVSTGGQCPGAAHAHTLACTVKTKLMHLTAVNARRALLSATKTYLNMHGSLNAGPPVEPSRQGRDVAG